MKRIQGTKGAISEKEMEAFLKASPGFRNSREGNEMILNMLDALEIRKQEKAKMSREYLETNGSMKGFDSDWKKHVDSNPILDPKTLEITNPKYKVQEDTSNPQAASNQQSAPKMLTFNPSTGKLE